MTNNIGNNALILRIQRIFKSESINVSEWILNSIIYNIDEEQSKLVSHIKQSRREFRDSTDLDPLVEGRAVPFLVGILGRDLLRFSCIRILLIKDEMIKNPNSIKRFAGIFEINSHNIDAITTKAGNMTWKLGNVQCKKFLKELLLPPSLGISVTHDSRSPIEFIRPLGERLELMPFQNKVFEDIKEYSEKVGKCLVVMPTGSGKTKTVVESILRMNLESMNPSVSGIIWIADRDELCEQATESFSAVLPFYINRETPIWRYWGSRDVEISDSNSNEIVEGIVVTSQQQLQKRLKEDDPIAKFLIQNAKCIVIDEAHRWLDWNEQLIKSLDKKNPECRIIGLTATPFRRESRDSPRLMNIFSKTIITPFDNKVTDLNLITEKLTNQKVLARRINVTSEEINSELNLDASSSKQNKEALSVINNLIKTGSKSIIVFTKDVKQARNLSICLNLDGKTSAHLDAKTPIMIRRAIIKKFREQDIKILLNYAILTTGFDAPMIDTVVILRNIEREDQPIIQQMIGRGLRGPLFGGTKTCRIFNRGMSF